MFAIKKQFRRGLVVGKFCPLHRGHELVIQRAIDCCDEVIVISYTKPAFAGYDRATREAWIRTVFPSLAVLVIDDESLRRTCIEKGIFPIIELPHNDAEAHVQRDFVGWLCWTVLQITVDAVFTSEDYGNGFAAALSAYFGTRTETAAVVRHICVDMARDAIPVSGTMVRTDPHACRKFLSPQVYAGFVRRICLLGGESSGKTTLAQCLAARLDTAWVPEYGRELWQVRGGNLQFEDMLHIACEQVKRENALLTKAKQWLFCDTSPLTTYFYSIDMFGKADPELERLALRTYDEIYLCAPDFLFVQDGTRRDDAFRNIQHAWYQDKLHALGMGFTLLGGNLETRVRKVESISLQGIQLLAGD